MPAMGLAVPWSACWRVAPYCGSEIGGWLLHHLLFHDLATVSTEVGNSLMACSCSPSTVLDQLVSCVQTFTAAFPEGGPASLAVAQELPELKDQKPPAPYVDPGRGGSYGGSRGGSFRCGPL